MFGPTKCDFFAIKMEELYNASWGKTSKITGPGLEHAEMVLLGRAKEPGPQPHSSCLEQLPAMPADAISGCSEAFYTHPSWAFSDHWDIPVNQF